MLKDLQEKWKEGAKKEFPQRNRNVRKHMEILELKNTVLKLKFHWIAFTKKSTQLKKG